jgi:hypothetical protein
MASQLIFKRVNPQYGPLPIESSHVAMIRFMLRLTIVTKPYTWYGLVSGGAYRLTIIPYKDHGKAHLRGPYCLCPDTYASMVNPKIARSGWDTESQRRTLSWVLSPDQLSSVLTVAAGHMHYSQQNLSALPRFMVRFIRTPSVNLRDRWSKHVSLENNRRRSEICEGNPLERLPIAAADRDTKAWVTRKDGNSFWLLACYPCPTFACATNNASVKPT